MKLEIALTLIAALHAPLKSNPAYLDPGSGSILIQLLIAGFLGALFVIRSSWSKIKTLFRRGVPEEEGEPEDER